MSRPKWEELIIEKPIACLASSLSSLISFLPSDLQSAVWYGSDILLNNKCELSSFESLQPKKIGSTEQFLHLLEEADQFQSGVMLALPIDQGKTLPGEYYTEDEKYRDIGNALVEIRAFDTTFWVVYGRDDITREKIREFASQVKGDTP